MPSRIGNAFKAHKGGSKAHKGGGSKGGSSRRQAEQLAGIAAGRAAGSAAGRAAGWTLAGGCALSAAALSLWLHALCSSEAAAPTGDRAGTPLDLRHPHSGTVTALDQLDMPAKRFVDAMKTFDDALLAAGKAQDSELVRQIQSAKAAAEAAAEGSRALARSMLEAGNGFMADNELSAQAMLAFNTGLEAAEQSQDAELIEALSGARAGAAAKQADQLQQGLTLLETGKEQLFVGKTGGAADNFAAGIVAVDRAGGGGDLIEKLQLYNGKATSKQTDQRRRARMKRKAGNEHMKAEHFGAARASFEEARAEADKAHDATLAEEATAAATTATAKQAKQAVAAERELEAGNMQMAAGEFGAASRTFAAGLVAAKKALDSGLEKLLAAAVAGAAEEEAGQRAIASGSLSVGNVSMCSREFGSAVAAYEAGVSAATKAADNKLIGTLTKAQLAASAKWDSQRAIATARQDSAASLAAEAKFGESLKAFDEGLAAAAAAQDTELASTLSKLRAEVESSQAAERRVAERQLMAANALVSGERYGEAVLAYDVGVAAAAKAQDHQLQWTLSKERGKAVTKQIEWRRLAERHMVAGRLDDALAAAVKAHDVPLQERITKAAAKSSLKASDQRDMANVHLQAGRGHLAAERFSAASASFEKGLVAAAKTGASRANIQLRDQLQHKFATAAGSQAEQRRLAHSRLIEGKRQISLLKFNDAMLLYEAGLAAEAKAPDAAMREKLTKAHDEAQLKQRSVAEHQLLRAIKEADGSKFGEALKTFDQGLVAAMHSRDQGLSDKMAAGKAEAVAKRDGLKKAALDLLEQGTAQMQAMKLVEAMTSFEEGLAAANKVQQSGLIEKLKHAKSHIAPMVTTNRRVANNKLDDGNDQISRELYADAVKAYAAGSKAAAAVQDTALIERLATATTNASSKLAEKQQIARSMLKDGGEHIAAARIGNALKAYTDGLVAAAKAQDSAIVKRLKKAKEEATSELKKQTDLIGRAVDEADDQMDKKHIGYATKNYKKAVEAALKTQDKKLIDKVKQQHAKAEKELTELLRVAEEQLEFGKLQMAGLKYADARKAFEKGLNAANQSSPFCDQLMEALTAAEIEAKAWQSEQRRLARNLLKAGMASS